MAKKKVKVEPKVEFETVGFGWRGKGKKTGRAYIRLSFLPETVGLMKPSDLEKKIYAFKSYKGTPEWVLKAPVMQYPRKESHASCASVVVRIIS